MPPTKSSRAVASQKPAPHPAKRIQESLAAENEATKRGRAPQGNVLVFQASMFKY